MKTELKDLSPTRKQIDVEIDAAAVRTVYDRVSDNYAKAANVPGFRPGHAPRAVVRTRFKDQIRTEVLRELLPDAVQKAIEEHKLEPLGEPELNLENSEGLDQLGQQPISFQRQCRSFARNQTGRVQGPRSHPQHPSRERRRCRSGRLNHCGKTRLRSSRSKIAAPN